MSRPPYQAYPHQHPHHGPEPIQVHNHDILCGRGVNIASHPGNERFRALVQSRHDENYCTAYTTSEKRAVAEQILHHIKSLDPPGRFLKRVGRAPTSRGLQGPWETLSDRDSVKKTCQALRDCNRTDRSGYASAVAVPDDVKQQDEYIKGTGLTNKQIAAQAAAAKVRSEGRPGPGMPMHQSQQHQPQQQPPYAGPPRVALAPGPMPMSMPYHSIPGVPVPMPVPMAPPTMSMGAASSHMPVRPDLSTTSSHAYTPAPMTLSPPPPQPMHHHHHPPPPPPPPLPHHHHHHHHQVHPMHRHHQHLIHQYQHHAMDPPGHAPGSGHHLPPSPHQQTPMRAPPPPQTHSQHPAQLVQAHHHPQQQQPAAVHHQAPPQTSDQQGHRRHSANSHSSETSSKRSRSTYEDDGTVSPSIENAAGWLKKQRSVDTRAPAPIVTTANTITPTDPVAPGFLSDGLMAGFEIGAPPARTPSQETSTTTGTTPPFDGANSLSRANRPSLSPASAMPPSPSLAYNPHHSGPANPLLFSHHHHDYAQPTPTPTAVEHPFAFHPHHEQAGAPSSDSKQSYSVSAAAAHHLDQDQLQEAAQAAAAAVMAADSQNGGDFATSLPGSFHHDDSLSML